MKKRIAIVNQRYGNEVNGGSEYYTQKIAEQLVQFYDVEILTTCALDYSTWENYYSPGVEEVNGISVRRFEVERVRIQKHFNEEISVVLGHHIGSRKRQDYWLDEQGPFCPKLVKYVIDNEDDYDVFIFVTYLYYMTVRALPVVAKKSILIPTAHNEPWIYFHIYRDVFQKPAAIIYLTVEEKSFVELLFQNQDIPNTVCALGIDTPPVADVEGFKRKHNLDDYIIYVGRIDESKGCKTLFRDFLSFKRRTKNTAKLVLMGKSVIDIPEHEDIVSLGFVTEEEKYNGIAGAKALVLPSHFESLSISVLEALSLSVPVLVNGDCSVLKGHCLRSNAGLYYTDTLEFVATLEFLLTQETAYKQMQRNAPRYVDEYYRWPKVLGKMRALIDQIAETKR